MKVKQNTIQSGHILQIIETSIKSWANIKESS